MARCGAGRAAALGLVLRLLLGLRTGPEAAPAPTSAPAHTLVQVSGPRAGSCPTDTFKCLTSGYCVPLSWRCDGDRDCSDGSDEEECRIEPCAQNRQCQPQPALPCSCDNISGCSAGSDKNLNCSRSPCQEGELRCILDDVCIPHTWRCDGHPDCPDSSDELSCDTDTETDKIFQEENATTSMSSMIVEKETSFRNVTVASAGHPSRNPNAYGVIAAAGLLVAVKESLLLSERKTSLI
ncbi:CD320 antigen isoform X1 [Rattus norvegicus]|uniref:CD320 antigen isoform X1 n=1 Tax=Rattus norvegicus TaxID=10116 RepID=UPI0003D0B739|nr:CD320 antigen isoform X1 [Rattus norvegicus]|eukprot:XP_006241190.1 PREDICTED: CD320 antigen isoform X1 [Rattus norvegicus]